MSRKRPAETNTAAASEAGERSTATADNDQNIFKSDPILDRRSVFVAVFSPDPSARDRLQKLPDFRDAMHRVAAWRRASAQQTLSRSSTYSSAHDDDGEAHAGRRLERVLDALQVEGCVVVARWYGGVLLGPVRFTHFETCAREAIKRATSGRGGGGGSGGNGPPAAKRLKEEEEDSSGVRDRLAQVLAKRDQSIAVLRELLADKTASSQESPHKSSSGSLEAPSEAASRVTPDYGAMPAQTLRRLEDARDRTIAFLLRQLDEAELKGGDGGGATTTTTGGAPDNASADNAVDDASADDTAANNVANDAAGIPASDAAEAEVEEAHTVAANDDTDSNNNNSDQKHNKEDHER